MAVTGLSHLTLAVSDLERSVAFYTDLLGGRLRAAGPRVAHLELGTIWLCLSVGTVDRRADYSHIALTCAPGDFDGLAARIRRTAPEWQENVSEGESVYFLDPDGHRLELHLGGIDERIAHSRAHPEKGVVPAS